MSLSTSPAVPERSAWARAECSESTGTSCPGEAAAFTSSPPTIRDSLLASARMAGVPSAASVGANPMEPVMPLSTTSAPSTVPAPHAAMTVEASGPDTISGAKPASPAEAARAVIRVRKVPASSEDVPTAKTRSATACLANSSRLPPPALMAVTVKRGLPSDRAACSTTSMAWVPMEPVEPRMITLRCAMVTSIPHRSCRGDSGSIPPRIPPVTTSADVPPVDDLLSREYPSSAQDGSSAWAAAPEGFTGLRGLAVASACGRVGADPSASDIGSRIAGLLHSAGGIVIYRGD